MGASILEAPAALWPPAFVVAGLPGARVLPIVLAAAVAINLFDINTFYVAAVPFWLAGALVCLLAPRGKNMADAA